GAIAAAVREGKVRSRTMVEASFARAAEVDAGPSGLNCILTSDLNGSLQLGDGAPVGGALAGVPVVLKDNIATTMLSTSCGSKILEGYVSPYESTVARKLREAGAILVGKGNMDEFAIGSSTEFSAYGPARNPIDRTRVPGGSSGGSAAAVAAGIVPIALGSETGGSVRQPAAFCGIVGVKPTYGRISRFGLVAFASSLDNIVVFGRTVDDAARAMEVVSGDDTANDATSALLDAPGLRTDSRDLTGIVIGRPKEYFPASLPAAMQAHCARAAPRFATSRCRTPISRSPSITSSRPRSARRTWPASTACATGCDWKARDCAACTRPRVPAASAPKSPAAFCSARTCFPRATTTRTIARRWTCARS